MKLFRTVPLDPRAEDHDLGGPLWFPRAFQGAGRHDAPAVSGCLYCAESELSAVAESLAVFRGSGGWSDAMLERFGRMLQLVELELADGRLIDLDDPRVLTGEGLRPSEVATHDRDRTRRQAAALHAGHPRADGLRWWSALEASWINVTLFDRSAPRLEAAGHTVLTPDHPVVMQARVFLGLSS